VRAVFVVLAAALLLNGCSGDKKPAGITSDAVSERNLKKDCADPKWQQQNLGLWYSLCRQPLRW
jgi:hypothetical protein